MLRESGCFVFRLAILDLFACLCLVSGAEGMAGQGGGLALIPWLLAFWGLGTVENVMRAEKFTVPFAVFAIRHGRKCHAGRKIYRALCRFCD